jgi:hypothetical protein
LQQKLTTSFASANIPVMDGNGVTRFFVEKTDQQVARRPRRAKDGALEIYLTRRQRNVVVYLGHYILGQGYTPTFREIAEACGYRSADAALRAVRGLAKLGLVTTDVRQARSIRFTDEGRDVYEAWKPKKRAK